MLMVQPRAGTELKEAIIPPSPQSPSPSSPVFAVQSLSRVRLPATPWTEACQASLSFTISQSLLKFMSIESVTPSNRLILCRPLLLLPSIFPSIRVFSNESDLCTRWPKDWSFSFSINPFKEYRVDFLVWSPSYPRDSQESLSSSTTVKKASVLQCSAFFMVQFSHPYMTTGKIITLTKWTFAGKVTSLLFNMLSRFVITFLPRSKRLLISWL